MIDTAGVDDSGPLGIKRIEKTRNIVKSIDMGILLLAENQFNKPEEEIIDLLESEDRYACELCRHIHFHLDCSGLNFLQLRRHDAAPITSTRPIGRRD